ncbi:hypothetical protein L9F63_007001 [Diploptera punctata]|uniref:G-protein coupled receptors family 1 profile domain-containing protein n=1 Tax=Diploptera punctata TaxID=6984 RepID=A0AAD8E475_DIPPU|nr:hypothetical protein L9F63_007001 [Diploptera punctata]
MDDILLLCDILLVIIFLTGTAANATVLLVFCRRPALRTLPNRFVVNLLCTNLVVTCVLVPLILADVLTDHQPVLYAVCDGIAAGVCSASVLAVLMIALDQYCAVMDPLHYHSRISKARSAGLMAITWTLSSALGVVHGLGFYPSIFAATYSVIVFVLPFSCILWMYACIYTAAHNNSKRTRISEAERTPSLRSTSSGLVNNIRYRISNASMFRYREETRAARISALVIVMVLLCWFPYVGDLAVLSSGLFLLPQYVHRVSLTLLASGTLISPCLFAYRNQRIQREARKLMGCPFREKQCKLPRPRPELLAEHGLLGNCIRTEGDRRKSDFVVNLPESALTVDTCRSSFSSGGSSQGTTSSLETD